MYVLSSLILFWQKNVDNTENKGQKYLMLAQDQSFKTLKTEVIYVIKNRENLLLRHHHDMRSDGKKAFDKKSAMVKSLFLAAEKTGKRSIEMF